MPWKPVGPDDFPTLGWDMLDWMSEYLASPDCSEYTEFLPTPEQAEFILRFYEIDPDRRARKIRRGVLSRPKGWGKSPALAALAAAEGLGPAVFDGWDADGQPVGKPWKAIRTPLVQLSAVSEDQTRNAWTPLLEMLRDGPAIDEYSGLEPMETFVNLPDAGRIEFVTASARSREGNRPIFCVLDQTETWTPSNGGTRLAATMRRNLGKTGGSSIESPNAYLPGEESVAESSASYWSTIREGKARDDGLLYDHREAPADTDLTDRESLIHGLRYAYGCSAATPCVVCKSVPIDSECQDVTRSHEAGWVDLDRVIAEIWDPDTDPQDARRYYLNQITHATDSYISQPEWAGCKQEGLEFIKRDEITLGFDGSRGRAKGKPDASALVACRVSDGYTRELGVWEADDGPGQEDWTPPLPEIDAAVEMAFATYHVVAFYADPAKDWRSKVNEWEAKYSTKMTIKATRDHPFEFWMTGGRSVYIERALEAFEAAVRNKELTHSGTYALTAHVLNARRRVRRQKLTIGKAHEYSTKKIDACVAAVLAWQARLDAIAAGFGTKKPTSKPIRVR